MFIIFFVLPKLREAAMLLDSKVRENTRHTDLPGSPVNPWFPFGPGKPATPLSPSLPGAPLGPGIPFRV